MNKKTVVSVLVCIVIGGFAISANAADIFSDDFRYRTPWVPPFPGHFFPDANKWDITYDQAGWNNFTVWWDIKPDWTTTPPQDPNNTSLYFLVLGQWGKNDTSDAGVITKLYQNISGLSYLTVKCKVRLEAFGNPIIQLKVNFWDNDSTLTPKGEVIKLIVDPNVPMTRLTWYSYSGVIAVPAGAGIAKFAINNDSSPLNEGTAWIDDFIVSDVVCLTPSSLDKTGNCMVDFGDFAIFASQWLTCGKVVQADCWQ